MSASTNVPNYAKWAFVGSITIALLSATPAFAPPPPPPPVPFDFSLDSAIQGASAALAECKTRGVNAIAEVVDRDGNIRAMLASDHFDKAAYDIVRKNIFTVQQKGMSSGDFARSLSNGRTRTELVQLITNPQFNPGHLLGLSGGAVPIMKAGVMVGIISVSGGSTTPGVYEKYEACANAGRDKIMARL